ncbi:cell division protein FtsW [Defluviimonas sp. 20V17]|uniref:Probable peptidoglycan glycosyltransferase FtsW n=2 Tax=Allgaiera indica TaxID=765699 RepID=A0A1H2ZLR6_9RHOB|nr:putative lipid II flippase FtsW [Allgaiera indica]KDB02301.1 cell division protein FtsW [Defluviimonas sp. 20V17]SDX17794.1 cell division protein FtsW [Allgaiera indica]
MTEMVYGAVPAQAGEPVLPRWWRTVDKWSLMAVFLLYGMGLLLGLAASVPLATRNGLPPFHYVDRQAVFGAVSMVVMLLTSTLSPDRVRRLGVVAFLFAFIALSLLPIFGSDFGKGATRWFSFGFITVQPSEFLKPFFVILCGWLMAASQEINGPPGKSISFAVAIVVVAFLAAEPDFGQSALILFAWGVMYFVAGAPITLLATVGAMVAGGGMMAYQYSDHFAKRINGYLAADVDPRTQIGYATNAIQEGGFFGVGVGNGQVKWSLPDAHTDFIIAVAAEEYGMILVFVIIALYAVIVIRSLARLMRERDPFIRLAGTGLACIFGVQAIVNMGVACRLLPAKGMTLPFVSYGGSSIIAAGITMGMLLAFTRTRPQGQIGDVLGRGR